ncbi:MAG: urease accessory protein UreE [Pseudomonadota bacterium]
MIRATDVLGPGTAGDTLILDFDARNRRRFAAKTAGGLDILVDLPRPMAIADGARLALEDGRHVVVQAADEDLLRVTPPTARIAWHLGNRHLAVEIAEDALFIRADHVIAEMLAGLGATTEAARRPFQPEGGAYAGHGHAHG